MKQTKVLTTICAALMSLLCIAYTASTQGQKKEVATNTGYNLANTDAACIVNVNNNANVLTQNVNEAMANTTRTTSNTNPQLLEGTDLAYAADIVATGVTDSFGGGAAFVPGEGGARTS